MNISINPPKGFLGWTIYLIIGKGLFDLSRYLYNNRGSSKETKKELAEIRKNQLTKEDFRKIIREENKDFITKELFEERINRVKEEIIHDYDIKFVKMESMHKESISKASVGERAFRDSREEHHKSKHRIDEVYGKLLEHLNGKKKK